jgi:hypothetical protein
MHDQPGLLLGTLDRHEAQLRLAHRGANRCGIVGIILTRQSERADELRRHDARGVAERRELAGEPVRARARLHAHETGPALPEPREHRLAAQGGLYHHAPGGILATPRHHALCQIQPHGSNLIHDFPSPVIERGNSIVALHCRCK